MNFEEENKQLKLENKLLKEQLSKYTNPERYKKYYEANREKLNEKQRIYAKKYYEKKKQEKLEKEEN